MSAITKSSASSSSKKGLAPLTHVSSAPGIGPKVAEKLAERGITTLYDVVWTLPVAYDDWTVTGSLDDALGQLDVPCVLEVILRNKHWAYFGGRRQFIASFEEVKTGKRVDGKWMFAAHGLDGRLIHNDTFLLRGKLRTQSSRAPSIINPGLRQPGQGTEPRYASTIGSARWTKLVAWALDHADLALCDPRPDGFDLSEALHLAHAGPVEPPIRQALASRLSFVSACARVIELASERRQGALRVGQHACLLSSKVTPTADQSRALAEVASDLRKGEAMRRILTGDVGTGKTWVALAAARSVLEAGGQVAYLCPTGLLAAQVHAAARNLGAGEPVLLTSGTPNSARIKKRIAEGDVSFVIGTHSLLHLEFDRLALAIIDEQHRLGVLQRLALLGKGGSVHLLSLTATPIPRTLARLISSRPGEVATSVLTQRPFERPLPSVTVEPESAWTEWVKKLPQERAFIVCPRLEQGPGSAKARVDYLAAHAPNLRVGLLHGAMSEREQGDVLTQFQKGELTTLVATTVIEVGIDVPEATLMIIDEADRFGLAQLHQLRGRVGRGALPGRAVLFFRSGADPMRVAQLHKFAAATSGLEVAELDLAVRGPGDRAGVAQSGFINDVYYDSEPSELIDLAAAARVSAGLEGVLAHAVRRDLDVIAMEQDA